jgi:hypothetical protein
MAAISNVRRWLDWARWGMAASLSPLLPPGIAIAGSLGNPLWFPLRGNYEPLVLALPGCARPTNSLRTSQYSHILGGQHECLVNLSTLRSVLSDHLTLVGRRAGHWQLVATPTRRGADPEIALPLRTALPIQSNVGATLSISVHPLGLSWELRS